MLQARGPHKSCITALALQPGLAVAAELMASLALFTVHVPEGAAAPVLQLTDSSTADVRCISLMQAAGGRAAGIGAGLVLALHGIAQQCSMSVQLFCSVD